MSEVGRNPSKTPASPIKPIWKMSILGIAIHENILAAIKDLGNEAGITRLRFMACLQFLAKKNLQVYGALGYCHLEPGQHLKPDLTKAITYFQKGHEQNDPCSQFYLGYCYEKGLGLPLNLKRAEQFYALAAAQEYPQALRDFKRLTIHAQNLRVLQAPQEKRISESKKSIESSMEKPPGTSPNVATSCQANFWWKPLPPLDQPLSKTQASPLELSVIKIA